MDRFEDDEPLVALGVVVADVALHHGAGFEAYSQDMIPATAVVGVWDLESVPRFHAEASNTGDFHVTTTVQLDPKADPDGHKRCVYGSPGTYPNFLAAHEAAGRFEASADTNLKEWVAIWGK